MRNGYIFGWLLLPLMLLALPLGCSDSTKNWVPVDGDLADSEHAETEAEPIVDGDSEPEAQESLGELDTEKADLTDGDSLENAEQVSEEEAESEAETQEIDQEEVAETEIEEAPIAGCIKGDFKPYHGLIHAHTGYSDGELTPQEAFPFGRDQGGLDFFIITDHLDAFYWKPIPWDKWQRCFDSADEFYKPGQFLTDCGYEDGFSVPLDPTSVGHNNVFYCRELFSPLEADFHTFYNTLIKHPGAISQFNHPGDDDQNRNNWEYIPQADPQINLFEFNGDAGLEKSWIFFFAALDAGWHISPTYNQDNHSADWGTKNDRRTGFFLPDLTREDMHEGMMKTRSFMTIDKNAWIKLVTDEGCWMGSILSHYPAGVLNVQAFDADAGDGFDRIELYTTAGVLHGSAPCENTATCIGRFPVAPSTSTYYVAKAVQKDGDILVSAPLWAKP